MAGRQTQQDRIRTRRVAFNEASAAACHTRKRPRSVAALRVNLELRVQELATRRKCVARLIHHLTLRAPNGCDEPWMMGGWRGGYQLAPSPCLPS